MFLQTERRRATDGVVHTS